MAKLSEIVWADPKNFCTIFLKFCKLHYRKQSSIYEKTFNCHRWW